MKKCLLLCAFMTIGILVTGCIDKTPINHQESQETEKSIEKTCENETCDQIKEESSIEETTLNNKETSIIADTVTEISAIEELNTLVTQCQEEGFGGEYLEDLTKQDFLLPYKDGYIGFAGGGNNSDGRGYYLTYRTLENPCTLIAKTPEIFFWVRNEGKVYFATDMGSFVPQKKVKDLNCSIDNFSDCRDEMRKFMNNLIKGNETHEYFSQWMNQFKHDIDNGIYRSWEYRSQKREDCNEKNVTLNKNNADFHEKYDQFVQECMAEYLN